MALTDKVGFRREAITYGHQWPATSPALVTDLLPMTSLQILSGITGTFAPATDATRIGFVSDNLVDSLPTLAFVSQARYAGFEQLFACALGFEARYINAVKMPEEVILGKAFRHLFECDHLLGAHPWTYITEGVGDDDIVVGTQRKVRRGTIAVQRDFSTWEFLSCMINQLTVGWEETSEGHINANLLAHSIDRDSAINTTTTLRKALLNASPSVLFHQGVMRIAPYSSSTALDSDDEISVKAWSFTLQNILQFGQGPRTGHSMEEPERSSGPGLLGSFNLPRYTSERFLDAWSATTKFMMDMKFTGPMIPGTSTPYQLNFYIPGLYVTQSDPSGPNPYRSNVPVQWFGTTPLVPAAGFPVGLKQGPIMIEVVNHLSAHSLLSA